MEIDAQTHNALNGVRRDNDPGRATAVGNKRERSWKIRAKH
jgi:hypothetical protein